MHIAFYAPMKSPTHSVPSGDRHVARLLLQALVSKDNTVELVSDLRAWEGKGDLKRQETIKQQAETEAKNYLQRIEGKFVPDIWFSYHIYHKAPDWIGPRVSHALGIPYVVAEASYAAKQVSGKWAMGLEQTGRCIEQANAIINLNNNDIDGIKHVTNNHERLHTLKPYLDVDEINSQLKKPTNKEEIARNFNLNTDKTWLIAVAMMRPGDKLASFTLLAQALESFAYDDCQLIIIGNGKARNEVEKAFANVPQDSVHLLGQLEHSDLLPLLSTCDLFIWPAVNEAYGMAMLEAQACGLPVVAGAYGGVSSIIEDGVTGALTKPGDTLEFSQAIRELIHNPTRIKKMSIAAERNVATHHSLESASARLITIMHSLI